MISIHEGIGDDLDRIAWATLFSELVIKGRSVDGSIYRLYAESLDSMEEDDVDRTAIYFLVHYLALSGLCGDYRVCPSCGRAFGDEEILGFSTLTGTAVCRECDNLDGTLILPPNARKYLARVFESSLEEALSLGLSADAARRISRNLLRSLRYVIPAPLKTLESGLLIG
ncbi:MAG: DNA repair protein RecO C-terminal domain-containing protein [Spirochaetales bacterium]|nr:DNA repair protein RecO C-terminal domain-containing protein [Candidatus Physcosoma equi]